MAIKVDGWSIVSQFRKCGKPTCRTCLEGKGHGPYYYGTKVINGKRERKYFGTQLPFSIGNNEINSNSTIQNVAQKGSMQPDSVKKATRKNRDSQKGAVSVSEEEIYHKIRQAILFQKLRPNMQLVEEGIAEVFGVSRTPIRNVFRRLAHEKLVTIIPNKGTFIYCPTVNESKDICEARRVLEAVVVRKASNQLNEEQFQKLELFIEEECAAQIEADFFKRLRLTCDFHLSIAEMVGNPYYYRYLEELISLTFVIYSFYGPRETVCCSHEHIEILNAMKKRDENLAEHLMTTHLKHLESEFDFDNKHIIQESNSLEDIFKDLSNK
ncbi:DUF6788 family protein [Metabacillus fastidiosus]|uniref:GntR family transcriptional regulator n=1 Tax=Metabacillus fastidiosus TaxID=1458 RepID=UPI003D294564